MIVCGMEMAASEVRLVILDGTKANFSHVGVRLRRTVLTDDENPDEVKAFQDTVYAFLRENGIEHVAIKKRAKRGTFPGGPISFKLEGIVQLYGECPVSLVSPQSISAAKRNHNLVVPRNIRKYQVAALETAFTALP